MRTKLFGQEGPPGRRVAEAVAEDDGGRSLDGGRHVNVADWWRFLEGPEARGQQAEQGLDSKRIVADRAKQEYHHEW